MSTDKEVSEYFEYRCHKGLKERGLSGKPEYIERLKYEVNVIRDLGYHSYFLVVSNIIDWANNNGVLVGPGRGCFIRGTKVYLSDGSSKFIEDVQVGDVVISHDGTSNNVEKILNYEIDETIITIELGNGQEFSCTTDHLILTKNRGWVQAGELTSVDDLVEIV